MFFIPEFNPNAQHYDIHKSYEWNYDNAPRLPEKFVLQPSQRDWSLAGTPVNSPIAVAAGPLLNGRWVLHYAALGFDVLTYKTVRSKSWPCYTLPNLLPIEWNDAGVHNASPDMLGSWAVSFGMPSTSPDLWRFDVEETRRLLPKPKKLSVSVVASPEPNWTVNELAEDYAKCAHWAIESGADFVELNFSCPNISTRCAQLYLDPDTSRVVVETVRQRIGDSPLLIKVGQVPSDQTTAVVDALAQADALVMINCIGGQVQDGAELAFDGHIRGIAGAAIRDSVRTQVSQFVDAIAKCGSQAEVIAVGGIRSASDVSDCLALGASGVQVATSIMSPPAT